jgi:hypothetical protein
LRLDLLYARHITRAVINVCVAAMIKLLHIATACERDLSKQKRCFCLYLGNGRSYEGFIVLR